MKKEEVFHSIPVIMITTEGEEESVANALRKGAIAYIKKPFRQRELFDLLDQVEKRLAQNS